ncbi:MAG: neutral zinc metallopeptidase [Acidimicrobiia bacterium]
MRWRVAGTAAAIAITLSLTAACADMGTATTVSSERAAESTTASTSTAAASTGASTTARTSGASTTASPPQTTIAKTATLPSDALAIASAAITDVQAFWSGAMQQVYGKAYTPLAGGSVAATSNARLPACGTHQLTYRDVQNNALYCPENDFVLYDTGLIRDLNTDYGSNVVATVIAHEFGHAIQNRAGVSAPTIIMELQADCFAGAWAAFANRTPSSPFQFGSQQLNATIGGFLEFRDEVGVGAQDAGAHGNAFDRVGAFQDGFEAGASRCSQYVRTPPTITEIPFTNAVDQANGGNLPYADIITLTLADLDRFWKDTFAKENKTYTTIKTLKPYNANEKVTCGTSTLTTDFLKSNAFYCSADDTLAWDDQRLETEVYDSIGDFAVSLILSNAWADAIQTREKSTLQGRARSLQQHCYSGAWVGSILRNSAVNQQLSLSPGDLDEGITSLLSYGDVRKLGNAQIGTAFERVAAFRKGLQQGVASCRS